MAKRVTREFDVFVILVDGNFQTVRAELDSAITVRDNFNESFQKGGQPYAASIVTGKLTYNPSDVINA